MAERIFVPFRLSVNFTLPATSVAFSDADQGLADQAMTGLADGGGRGRGGRAADDA